MKVDQTLEMFGADAAEDVGPSVLLTSEQRISRPMETVSLVLVDADAALLLMTSHVHAL